jgi:hypothetical protein
LPVGNHLVCISDFTRNAVLSATKLSADRVITIHIGLNRPTPQADSAERERVLSRWNLTADQYLLYPANFWPHKNHAMLLTAFGIYRARHPTSTLKLVCPGAGDGGREYLREASLRMGLADRVVFPGFVSEDELANLLQASGGLIFPSLYEGFGIPIVEALAAGKPVLCSNAGSLPEIAGDAALFFDPRMPEEIVNAIERITTGPSLADHLSERGYARYAACETERGMAMKYLEVFREAVCTTVRYSLALDGVFSDRWTGDRVTIGFGPTWYSRIIEMRLSTPQWWPWPHINAILTTGTTPEKYVIGRSRTLTIRKRVPRNNAFFELRFDPVVRPKRYAINEDDRSLGPLCEACRVISPFGVDDLLRPRDEQRYSS